MKAGKEWINCNHRITELSNIMLPVNNHLLIAKYYVYGFGTIAPNVEGEKGEDPAIPQHLLISCKIKKGVTPGKCYILLNREPGRISYRVCFSESGIV